MATIDKLPSGSWRVRVSVKENGRHRQKSITVPTKKDALHLAARYEKAPAASVGEMVEKYIDAKNAVLSPSTIRAYRSIAKTIKTRYSAFWRVVGPSPAEVQALADDFSPKTARNVVGLLTSSARFSGTDFPRPTFKRWDLQTDFIPREEDVEKVLAEVSGTKMELPVMLGILGLRRSEVCALTPEDLDGNKLHIHAAVVLDSENNKVRKETKTRGSDRTIVVPDHVAEMLMEGPVELSVNSIGKRFEKITKRLGIRMRFHDLRHYFVSYCHNVLRLTDAQVMKLGGWSTDSVMKRHYRQSMKDEETAQQVAETFSHVFSHAMPKKRVK